MLLGAVGAGCCGSRGGRARRRPRAGRRRATPVAIRASTTPTSTVCVDVDQDLGDDARLTGAGTSVSILSVEISQIVCSASILSPTLARHATTVPSATETPIWGIVTSTSVVGQ